MIDKPKDESYAMAEQVLRRLRASGRRALFAGGCVRDLLMGCAPKDYDVATDATPEQVEDLFERTIQVGRRFGVTVVIQGGEAVEVATFRTESDYSDGRHPDAVDFCGPEQDALRRDFTINAMFWDPIEDRVLDYAGGLEDLKGSVLRAVGDAETRFREDHIRLIRAVRFAARLHFEIEEKTRRAIRRLAHLVMDVSAERLREELRIILTDDDPAAALRLMDELDMLGRIFPELEDARGCEQPENYHPEGDVFVHTILTVEKLGPRPDFELAMAALLHDVGKPQASRRAGRYYFPDHERIGAEMARAICRRLRLSNQETMRIRWLVKRHMYFKDAQKMRGRTLKRLFAEPGFEQLAELHRADALASWGNLTDYEYVMAHYRDMPPEQIEPERLINGSDLIEMGYRPGPFIGEALRLAAELADRLSPDGAAEKRAGHDDTTKEG